MLPAGWQEHKDASSGKSYFHNAATAETTWDRPGGNPPPAAVQLSAPAAVGALPQGWQEHHDAASGKSYYHNPATGQTVWDRPQASAAPSAMPSMPMPMGGLCGPATLPAGWQEHQDPSTGKSYFHNAATGVTTWDRPGGGSQFGQAPLAGLGGFGAFGGCGAGCGAGLGGFGGFGAVQTPLEPIPGLKMGTVKVWFEDKGFGFIAQADGSPDVFVHRNALEDGQMLVQGAQVQYDSEWDAKKNKLSVKQLRGAAPAGAAGTGVQAVQPNYSGASMAGGGAPPPGGQNVTGQMQGTVKAWNDEKGFGFIGPTNGGVDIFVHRNALLDGHTLGVNTTVTYVAEWNPQKSKYTATQCWGAVADASGSFGAAAAAPAARASPYGQGASAMQPVPGSAGPPAQMQPGMLNDFALQQASLQAQQALQAQMGFGM